MNAKIRQNNHRRREDYDPPPNTHTHSLVLGGEGVLAAPREKAGIGSEAMAALVGVYLLSSVHSLARRKIFQRTGDFPGRQKEAAKFQRNIKQLYVEATGVMQNSSFRKMWGLFLPVR